ncbi:peptidyl-prolyl cis-trans isomerase NIMA-interacting 1 [Entomortierella parvispora]|uniref:Peptidyl-prolyl cis-trans isomerase n=1 Tax=Entomortierella parvispora TaxID=205924 RepID=A0A9P3HFI6_9FUNG|nr:peptidyl-prolyl cis-trans isomerase NIMA-interacting 1 [Entomortierella parvispora]
MSSANYNLPNDWELRWSRSRNLPYFYNRITSEARWQAPEGVNPSVILAFQKDYESQHQHQQDEQIGATAQQSEGVKRVRVSHLLVKHSESRRPSSWREVTITRTKEEALKRLEEFQAKIKAGQSTLAELAATESDCSSAKKSGDLGFFERGQMQPPFEKASFALKIGEMSTPVWTESGVHLILRTG